MKFKLLTFLLSLAVAGSTASALTITATNNYGATTSGQYLAAPGASFSDSFNLTASYNPLSQQITSAFAEFLLWDAQGSNPETATVTVGGVYFGSGSNFSSLVIDGAIIGSVLLDLQADGILAFTVQNTTGAGGGTRDFYLTRAVLTAQVADRPTNNVPDGGVSIALLGLSLTALAVGRRAFAK